MIDSEALAKDKADYRVI